LSKAGIGRPAYNELVRREIDALYCVSHILRATQREPVCCAPARRAALRERVGFLASFVANMRKPEAEMAVFVLCRAPIKE
jgi:hypothetical protein